MKGTVVMVNHLLSVTTIILAFSLVSARADTYTYDADFAIGTDTVTGVITTDSDSGYLTSSDIKSWSFQLDSSNGFSSTGSNPVLVISGADALSATSTSLVFEVSGSNEILFCEGGEPGSCQVGGYILKLESTGSGTVLEGYCCSHPGDASLAGDSPTLSSVQIATAAPAATPVPAALPLFASGLGALGLFGWRRKRKAALAA
jgi:hypothetical protein